MNLARIRSSLVPQQIEARIDQDPAISAQLSLWNQQGSGVIRGNLLVIPIGNSLLYVEPLYLQAQNGKIPELKRVVVASADRVVMGENLGIALIKLFGRETVTRAGLQDLAIVAEAGEPAAASGATDTVSWHLVVLMGCRMQASRTWFWLPTRTTTMPRLSCAPVTGRHTARRCRRCRR